MRHILPAIIAMFTLASGSAIAAPTGPELLSKHGCYSCHNDDKKLVGPAFKDVGERYKNDKGAKAYLTKKVREGGSGAWGPVPMPPQPKEKVPDEDLSIMLDYILSLRRP